MEERKPRLPLFLQIFIGLLLLVLATLAYEYHLLDAKNSGNELKILKLSQNLKGVTNSLASTTLALHNEQSINESFFSQIGQIQGKVSTLDKLSKTDPELLRKYSEVYFLSENYVPASLSQIDNSYVYNKKRSEQILSPVWEHLKQMMDSASSSRLSLEVISAYRSFVEQKSLKTGYMLVYGIGANKFSADQGYSEHQLGTTVDLTTPALGDNFSSFGKTQNYKGLTDNAYRYGFILSYPPNNGYYQFEPWHWRFVGVALAAKLHSENKYFYNDSQRDINTYLVNIFD